MTLRRPKNNRSRLPAIYHLSCAWWSFQGIAFVPGGTTFIVGCSDGDVFAFDTKVSQDDKERVTKKTDSHHCLLRQDRQYVRSVLFRQPVYTNSPMLLL